jgi:hypothetical protein
MCFHFNKYEFQPREEVMTEEEWAFDEVETEESDSSCDDEDDNEPSVS